MKTDFASKPTIYLNSKMYSALNELSEKNPNVGRLLALPVALIRTGLDTSNFAFISY